MAYKNEEEILKALEANCRRWKRAIEKNRGTTFSARGMVAVQTEARKIFRTLDKLDEWRI